MNVVEPGPGFILTEDGDNYASDVSLDLVLVEPNRYLNHATAATLVLRLTNAEAESITGVGIELTRNDMLYLAREINLMYEDLR